MQWVHKVGETITYNMGYRNGCLLVEQEGHYYLYSKVTLNVAEECSLIQHKVMKVTKAYDQAIELMKSKRFVSVPLLTSFLFCCGRGYNRLFESNLFAASHLCLYRYAEICAVFICFAFFSFRCWSPKLSSARPSGGEDLWNSFLAGIFHLQSGDEIFVTLEDIQKMRTGTTENLMGAFMISP